MFHQKTETQQGTWFSCAGVVADAVRDSHKRESHATCAVQDLRGQVVRGIEIVTVSGKMNPRQFRFDFSSHCERRLGQTTFSLFFADHQQASCTTGHHAESAKSTQHLSFSCRTRCGASQPPALKFFDAKNGPKDYFWSQCILNAALANAP